MTELIAYAGPMLVLAAMVCGWGADAFSPVHGHGLLIDMGLGLAGGVVLAAALYVTNAVGPVGLVTTFLVGATGAAVAILAQRRFWHGPALPA